VSRAKKSGVEQTDEGVFDGGLSPDGSKNPLYRSAGLASPDVEMPTIPLTEEENVAIVQADAEEGQVLRELPQPRQFHIVTIPDLNPGAVQTFLNSCDVYWIAWLGFMQVGRQPDSVPASAVNILIFASKERALEIGGRLIALLRLPKGLVMSSFSGEQSIVDIAPQSVIQGVSRSDLIEPEF
jgi:hypothetical protein